MSIAHQAVEYVVLNDTPAYGFLGGAEVEAAGVANIGLQDRMCTFNVSCPAET